MISNRIFQNEFNFLLLVIYKIIIEFLMEILKKYKTYNLLVFVVMSFTNICLSQEPFFLDSLFKCDVSQISDVNYANQLSTINRLKNDLNISVGLNVSNSIQDEFDTGMSTRFYARIDVLSDGYFDNLKKVETIHNQMKLDSLNGIQSAIDQNYSIYYNYIQFLYNNDKLILIDKIIKESTSLKKLYQTLYYNKLVDYEEILFAENIQNQFENLNESQFIFNQMFSEIINDSIFPVLNVGYLFEVDFQGLLQLLDQDTTQNNILNLNLEINYTNYEQIKSPSFSFTGGYDFSRHRPYFSANLAIDIQPNVRKDFVAKQLKIDNDHRLQLLVKKKELLNLQYEYRYKENQLENQFVKLRGIEEKQRKFKVKEHLLELKHGIKEKKMGLEKLLVEYEIKDIKTQLMLLLLKIKKVIPMLMLAPCVKVKKNIIITKKFAGVRFLHQTQNMILSKSDQHFINHNEILLLGSLDLLELNNSQIIYPGQFNNRADFENEILKYIVNDGIQNFIIHDLDELKKLEFKTLEQNQHSISSFMN